jgi:hypothetical protein
MRTILLAGAAALALSVAPALASSHAGSGGLINKSANAAGGSNSASTGGSAGNGNGNTHVNVSHSLDNNTLNSDNTSHSDNTSDTHNTTTKVQGNSGAGAAGNAASATDGGTAVNAALGSYDVSDKTLSVAHTSTRTTDIIAQATATGTVSGNHTAMEKAGFSGLYNNMTDSVNGQGILSAQQNTGANALQQVTVSLGSVVGSGTGFGAATNSAH